MEIKNLWRPGEHGGTACAVVTFEENGSAPMEDSLSD